jgi:glycosyltransferase involved in cell wall biosynthesis
MIFFSVVIPTYNRSKLVIDTINSVLSQNYPHFEVIIVDDGSTDDTAQIIQDLYAADPRVRYFYKQNEERGAARNFGMQKAKGDYAVIFDSDDWMHGDHLSVIGKYITDHSDLKINFIATKYQFKDETGKIITGYSSHLKKESYGLDEMLKGSQFGCMYAINLHNPDLHLFPPERKYSTLEDWMFLLQNLQRDKIYLIDKVTITVRHHDNRSMSMNQRVINARKDAVKWSYDNLKLTEKQKKILLSYSAFFCGIHYYLDNNSKAALKETLFAMKIAGPKKEFVLLLLRSLLGRRLINWLKK